MRRTHRLLACVASVLFGAGLAHMMRGGDVPHPAIAHAAVAEPPPLAAGAPPPIAPIEEPIVTDVLPPSTEDGARRALGAQFARGKIITGATPHRLLLFTFDDGPDLRTTPRLLDTLDALDVRAVFFLSSGRIQPASDRGRERADLAREIVARGHMVADHTVDHAILTRLSPPSVRAQLRASQAIFVEVFGDRPWLFRPPGGARSDHVDAVVAEEGYTQVLWNLGAPDHRVYEPRSLVATFRSSLAQREASTRWGGGGIVLLHDTHEWTVDAVPAMVDEVRARNCALLERGEALWDIVDDPALFFEPRGDAPPGAIASSTVADEARIEARQERLRAITAERCAGPSAHDVLADASGALAPFFAALDRTSDGSLARVVHMGDSNIDRDQLPHALRTRFQERFGDGGAGFIPIVPSTPEYVNRMVSYSVEVEWGACSILTRCDAYHHYGLAGVVARTLPGSRTRIATRTSGPGRVASRIELWYGVEPGGGGLELRIDRGPPRRIATDAAEVGDRFVAVDVPAGRHEVVVQAGDARSARAYGVVLESDGPGVVWDTLGASGAFTTRVLAQDPDHFARQLAHRRPDLVVVQFGGNDLRRYLEGEVSVDGFRAEQKRLLDRVRTAVPGAACMLVGMGDHGKSGPMRVRPQHVEPLVTAQREAAAEARCAFFDTYAAMGGRGSIHRWQREGLASGDLVHLTSEGRRRMAARMYDALIARYESASTPLP